MKYSRNQINKAGDTILTSKDPVIVTTAIEMVNDWRTNHLVPLNTLGNKVVEVLNENKIKPMFTSQRLKRLTSIQYKLDLNPSMKLGGMQDIGGLRIVLKDVPALNKALTMFLNKEFDDFTLEKINDYVTEPKISGYRSIHFVYKYHSTDETYDGLRVELQIRTKLQHNWATAVETAGLYTQTSLKSNQGDNKWLSFFKIVSSLFAIKERLPVMIEHKGIGMEKLMVMCHTLNQKNKFSDILKALRVTVHSIEQNFLDKEYYIIYIDFLEMKVNIYAYEQEEENDASLQYSELEKGIEDNKNAVVFVSVSSIKDLRNAYPSYFLDTSEFIEALRRISLNCKKMNLIKE